MVNFDIINYILFKYNYDIKVSYDIKRVSINT